MGLGASLFLIAIGAILVWAVNAQVSGVNVHTVGWILMVIGLIGLGLLFVLVDSWRGRWPW